MSVKQCAECGRADVSVEAVDRYVDALTHIKRVCENARASTRRLRWIIERVKSALAGNDDWKTVDLPRHDPAIERLEGMIVAVYPIAKAELTARRELYECADDEIPDELVRREVEVLARFVRDAPHVSQVIRHAEGGR